MNCYRKCVMEMCKVKIHKDIFHFFFFYSFHFGQSDRSLNIQHEERNPMIILKIKDMSYSLNYS